MAAVTSIWSPRLGDVTAVDSSLVVNTTTTGITASTTQSLAGAVPLTSVVNNIAVCATTGNAVALPAANAAQLGDFVVVINKGAAAAGVYPQAADTIDALSAGTSIGVGNGKRAIFFCYALNSWASMGGAVSS